MNNQIKMESEESQDSKEEVIRLEEDKDVKLARLQQELLHFKDQELEMEHLMKKIRDTSDIIGKLRHQLIASQMEKESSDRTIAELRCKLLESERKVDELTRQNLEVFENNEDLKRLLFAIENEKKEAGDAEMHACNVSSKRGSQRCTPQTSSKKIRTAKNTNAESSSNTKSRNESPNLNSKEMRTYIQIDSDSEETDSSKVRDNITTVQVNHSIIRGKGKGSMTPVNPEASLDAISKFLFDNTYSRKQVVVNYGSIRCTREDLACLLPETSLNGTVVNCVSHYCNFLDKTTADYKQANWFLPVSFSLMCIMANLEDEKIIKHGFKSAEVFTINDLRRIFVPINDCYNHWYLVIIDMAGKTISYCDTKRDQAMETQRKNIALKVINKLDHLMQQWDAVSYEFQDIAANWNWIIPDFVPIQPNEYDCGLYVCIMMTHYKEMQKRHFEGSSRALRNKLAVQLYQSKCNKLAWKA